MLLLYYTVTILLVLLLDLFPPEKHRLFVSYLPIHHKQSMIILYLRLLSTADYETLLEIARCSFHERLLMSSII